MTFLTIKEINKQEGKNLVLKDVSFQQQQYQKIAIAGETGSGKSTLLKIIAGLIQPNSGEVQFGQQRVLGPEEKLIPGHPAIAYLSQHFELRNNYTVEEVLIMANRMTDESAIKIYDVCQIEHLLKRRTDQLSGGEKQRIAIARLLISKPKLLLLDEPYSNLDMVHRNVLKAVINNIGEELKITCILISHDPLDTLSWANEILVMKEGQIIQKGTPQQIYYEPVDTYVAGLFGSYNLLGIEAAKALAANETWKINGQIFFRSERFRITREEKNSLMGEVIKANFFGSYYEIEVAVSKDNVNIKSTDANVRKGDIVYISLAQ